MNMRFSNEMNIIGVKSQKSRKSKSKSSQMRKQESWHLKKVSLDLIYGEGVISLDAYKQLESTGKYETRISEPVATRQLVMNTKKEQLSDERVRHALQYGFNKKSMVEGVTSGLEEKQIIYCRQTCLTHLILM